VTNKVYNIRAFLVTSTTTNKIGCLSLPSLFSLALYGIEVRLDAYLVKSEASERWQLFLPGGEAPSCLILKCYTWLTRDKYL